MEEYLVKSLINKIETLTTEVENLRRQVKANSLGNMYVAKICKAILIPKAAEILSCSDAKIKKLLKDGDLKGITIGGKQYITIASLIRIQTPL